MPFSFTPASLQPYTPGSLFLGRDPYTFQEVGIPSERHFLTIAGSGSGKGSSLIIPNLKRWPHNVICIDPGGGNVKQTWQDREAMGQNVYVFDPFNITASAGVPDRLRVTFNPLQNLDPDDPFYGLKVAVIADGMVLRSDPKHSLWDNRGRDLISGVIDMVVRSCPKEYRSLTEVRRLLTLPPKLEPNGPDDVPEDLTTLFTAMAQLDRGPLARDAGGIGLGDLQKPNDYIGTAKDSTAWLDTPAIADVLQPSNFDFSELKHGNASVFLVLHPDYLTNFARFLRLFVRMALSAMGESEGGRKCLFILDEFYSLGKIDQVQKSAGLMRKNGVQLWPILQDLGQLQELYGDHGSMTFLGNSDAHIFFGLTDPVTLDHVSKRIGAVTVEDIGTIPPEAPIQAATKEAAGWASFMNNINRAYYETGMNHYNHQMKKLGSPRLTALEVRELVAKKDNDDVARSMIVFGKGGDIFNILLSPYFQKFDIPTKADTVINPPVPTTIAPSAAAWWFCKVFAVSWIISFSLVPLGLIPQMPSFNYITVMATIATVITLLCWDVVKLPPIPSRLKYALGLCGALFISFRMVIHAKSKLSASCSFLCPDPVWIWGFAIVSTAVLSFIWFRLMARWPEKL